MFSYGFFNSLNGDRKYSAEQISAIFDGLITDGVFNNIGELFVVTVSSGMDIIVKTGRAWFNHTWSLNDSWMVLTVEPPDVGLDRVDAVVLEVNSSINERKNSIKIVKGVVGVNPNKPSLIDTDDVHQHALAYVTVHRNAETIKPEDIEIVVGGSQTPFVSSLLESVSIDDLFNQWEGEFDTWFEHLQEQLGDDVATNLQAQIDARVKITDKATDEDIRKGTPDKWVSSDKFKDLGISGTSFGDIVVSTRNLEEATNGQFIACDQRVITDEALCEKLKDLSSFKYRYPDPVKIDINFTGSYMSESFYDDVTVPCKPHSFSKCRGIIMPVMRFAKTSNGTEKTATITSYVDYYDVTNKKKLGTSTRVAKYSVSTSSVNSSTPVTYKSMESTMASIYPLIGHFEFGSTYGTTEYHPSNTIWYHYFGDYIFWSDTDWERYSGYDNTYRLTNTLTSAVTKIPTMTTSDDWVAGKVKDPSSLFFKDNTIIMMGTNLCYSTSGNTYGGKYRFQVYAYDILYNTLTRKYTIDSFFTDSYQIGRSAPQTRPEISMDGTNGAYDEIRNRIYILELTSSTTLAIAYLDLDTYDVHTIHDITLTSDHRLDGSIIYSNYGLLLGYHIMFYQNNKIYANVAITPNSCGNTFFVFDVVSKTYEFFSIAISGRLFEFSSSIMSSNRLDNYIVGNGYIDFCIVSTTNSYDYDWYRYDLVNKIYTLLSSDESRWNKRFGFFSNPGKEYMGVFIPQGRTLGSAVGTPNVSLSSYEHEIGAINTDGTVMVDVRTKEWNRSYRLHTDVKKNLCFAANYKDQIVYEEYRAFKSINLKHLVAPYVPNGYLNIADYVIEKDQETASEVQNE